jgi:hypothetical protein
MKTSSDSKGGDELRNFVTRGITRFGLPLMLIAVVLPRLFRPPPERLSAQFVLAAVVGLFAVGVLIGTLYGIVMWWFFSRGKGA